MTRDRGQMTLVAFMQASNVSVYSGSWRYPSAAPDFLDLRYYQRIARVLEEGTFDLMFFDDRLAMPSIYGGSPDEAVRYGARPVKLDLMAVLGAAAAATSHLGLGATYSTTYYPPFHVARSFATLDHLSGGRAAWNVVTSVNDAEARNFGVDQHLGHDARYDRAEEFIDVVTRLWDSWEDDALVMDRESGIFADPEKVHELAHAGAYFDVQGPLTVPRPPQGRPPIIQAGQSGRGMAFAARWADLIFTADPSREIALEHYRAQKQLVAEEGRDPQAVRVLPMAYTVVGETEAIAREKEEIFLDRLVHPTASLALLSEVTNHDFSGHALDDVVTDELIDSVSGIRGLVQGVRRHVGAQQLTLRTLANHRATLLQGPRFVGTGAQVADQMEEWFRSEACDGFVLAATHFPGAFEDVVRMVVPELRRRGVFRDEYTGTTLREHLGLDRPTSVFARSEVGVDA
ncbi:LLM class flavin-dependent oxidoreductase [Pseudonocardia sp. KRD-184]|uniref:LLM class flavin-dependent oxidoreductase n=1 Tax=Pseudonocardia oceani TaxID=2792013 RepID=A0ABS6U4D3_9PSEU|nr:LLM class flavin-dependent oxidoreductase [Pseudonocardia oceani]MBW0090698.1 LLM class flavin-dependent oxidoreductase [Pseudonocardia oceani]MBW0097614.1 LLM class flavin-dependent oxidoreductase [Pseudonocardia oceani]MBW0124337.1 LLM class flavin-dependent oxidoreductase [Pseudonocardia oceani]MBW0127083.1 LLM class flavin-dependent oxidoreductase [Pseudonocardia oceani]